jgi:hypothetical protein
MSIWGGVLVVPQDWEDQYNEFFSAHGNWGFPQLLIVAISA